MMARAQPLRAARIVDAYAPEATDEALAALRRDVDAFVADAVTPAQRALVAAEAETILRRLAVAEAEAARERDETAALADERDRYARAAEALAQQGSATAEDARDVDRAIAAADRIIAAQRAEDARGAAWLDGVRGAVAGLMATLAGAPEGPATAPSPPVLRSLSRVGAMLGAMLREVEAHQDRQRAALSAAEARPFAGLERNPAVAAAVARTGGNE